MNYSPRLLVILLLALTVSVGCSLSRSVQPKDHSYAVTPKARTDCPEDQYKQAGVSGAQAATPGSRRYEGTTPGSSGAEGAAAYYGGYYERYGLGQRLDESAWSQEEIQAASFLHSSNIYFHFDSSTLTADAKEVLRQKAERLKDFPQLSMLIAGHSDERGTDEYNILLGDRRARAAYKYLVSLGVSASQLSSASFGKRFPVSRGNSEKEWSRNRRDEFMVYKP